MKLLRDSCRGIQGLQRSKDMVGTGQHHWRSVLHTEEMSSARKQKIDRRYAFRGIDAAATGSQHQDAPAERQLRNFPV